MAGAARIARGATHGALMPPTIRHITMDIIAGTDLRRLSSLRVVIMDMSMEREPPEVLI